MTNTAMQPNSLPVRLTLDHIEPFIHLQSDCVSGKFRDIQLCSAFQPIFSLAHRRPVGYEALLRPRAADGTSLSPLAVFDMAQGEVENVFLDRLCRIVHTQNFLAQSDDTNWLFLNINPLVTIIGKHHGAFFADVLERYHISPHRVVIEILEGKILDEGLLAESVMFFKELGCLVAIDDFGAGHSNFERIWRIQPHIVKLDRSIITQAAANRAVRRVIPNLVNLIHEAGSLALMEGVENEEEALIAMDSDVDFVQGYYFAKPSAMFPPGEHGQNAIDELSRKFSQANKHETGAYRTGLHPYLDAFDVFLKQFKLGLETGAACQCFLDLPRTERCYLLDKEGRQLGGNFISYSAPSLSDPRFKPLADSRDATWARRHYFRRAIGKPGEIQVSRPYLSIAGGNMCVTLSVAVFNGKELLVLCGDLMWND
ncbi:MAG: EAL domain-containing protein [Nitrosomonadales bacterium]|nr:EAL domain-containing protein [Nitrosomonadales bacterium]